MDEIDFSNTSPTLMLNIDVKNGGDVLSQFRPYSNEEMKDFVEISVFPILPEEAFTNGGLTLKEYSERISTLCNSAALNEKQYFKGVWKNKPDKSKDEKDLIIKLETKKNAVSGQVLILKFNSEAFELDNINLIGNVLKFTCRKQHTFIEGKGLFDKEKMNINIFGIEEHYGKYTLYKE